MCGFGLASFIFSFIVQAIVNPENAQPNVKTTGGFVFDPDSDQAKRVPFMLRMLALCWVCLAAVALILVRRKSKDEVPKSI